MPGDPRERALADLNEELAAVSSIAGPTLRPRDAAALILVDHSRGEPKILVGRRNPVLKFLPGKFVFPGGALDSGDRRIAATHQLDPDALRKLLQMAPGKSPGRLRGMAIAAIRELAEETGLMLGEQGTGCPSPAWPGFAERTIAPRLNGLRFVARAITPPGMIRRYDTRFFAADATEIVAERHGVVGPDAELVELRWTTVEDAKALDLHVMTRAVVAELAEALQTGLQRAMPVPFFRTRRGRYIRDYIF